MIEDACSACADALAGKAFSVYTTHDFDLRTQRSVLEKVAREYPEYVANMDLVRSWCAEYMAKKDRVSHIIAGTWRWCLGIKDNLPVKIQKQR